MSDLKPCPFCGCEMEIATVGRDWWRIQPRFGHEDLCMFEVDQEHDCSQQYPIQLAIADWNNRFIEEDKAIVPRTIPQELLDKMRDERVLSPSRVLDMLIEWSEK